MILTAVLAVAFIENLIPPFPSDVIIVFAGSLVALGTVSFVPAVLAATAGSTLGFVAMYKIGDWFGDRFLETGRVPFVPVTAVRKVEAWFGRYGYWVIAANRFLAGTRAVVSFFAGMSELDLRKTTLLSAASALCWNTILVATGYSLGHNWEAIGEYLATYSRIVTAAVGGVAALWLGYVLLKRRFGKGKSP
jgi:membrane protein DedA with SNARE-associated domain